MNRKEILSMLSILKSAYPNFYRNITKQEAEQTVNLYEEMFKDYDSRIVLIAVKELINSYEYPPTIATIKNKIYSLSNINEETDLDLWERLLKAIKNGTYGSEKEFELLPQIIKDYLKSPYQLQELASMNSDDIHSVVKGQFLREIKILKERKKEIDKLSPEMKTLLTGDNLRIEG